MISRDPLHPALGYHASYRDARQTGSATRFIPDVATGFPDLDTAQAACEADLRRLLGRLS